MNAVVENLHRQSPIPLTWLGVLLAGCAGQVAESALIPGPDPDERLVQPMPLPPAALAPQLAQDPAQAAQLHQGQRGGPGTACESNPNPTFTTSFTDLAMIQAILPPAVISGERFKNRSYISIARDAAGEFFEVPIYAPVDSTLVSITYFTQPAMDANDRQILMELYILDFQVSCEVLYGFDHVDRLVGAVGAVAPPEPAPDTRDAAVYVTVPVKESDPRNAGYGRPQDSAQRRS